MRRSPSSHYVLEALIFCLLTSAPLAGQTSKTQAQNLIDATIEKHPEITGLELSVTPVGEDRCMTIAATDRKDLGEKCDQDEATALKTLKPFVEHEPDGFDVTAPLHDAVGRLIGTLGIDFKPQRGQTRANILKRSAALLKEVEQQIPSKDFLFQPLSDN